MARPKYEKLWLDYKTVKSQLGAEMKLNKLERELSNKEITTLRVQLATANKQVSDEWNRHSKTRGKLATVKCNLIDAEAQLAKFGGHTAKCAHWAWKPTPESMRKGTMNPRGRILAGKKCDCGWAEVSL